MNAETDEALRVLATLGFTGSDVYLAELIPVVEMAWADGAISPGERAMLEARCEAVVERLNTQCGARLFTLGKALKVLDQLTRRRLTPAQRVEALQALRTLWSSWHSEETLRSNLLTWAEAVATVDGEPEWDSRELFWLQTMKRNLPVAS
ncbi:MAG: hypothetical protein JNG84_09255 [Archangium sp.]|nr:hypothetical protein [Archangium sp.]